MDQVWLDLLLNFAATLVGVILGIPVALWLDRKITAQRRREEESYLLGVLRDNLNHNLNLMNQIKRELPNNVVFYHLDLSPWQTHSGRLDSIKNRELVQVIATTYYELEHLNRKLNIQLEMNYSPFVAVNGYPLERKRLVDAILLHTESLIGLTKKAFDMISEFG